MNTNLDVLPDSSITSAHVTEMLEEIVNQTDLQQLNQASHGKVEDLLPNNAITLVQQYNYTTCKNPPTRP